MSVKISCVVCGTQLDVEGAVDPDAEDEDAICEDCVDEVVTLLNKKRGEMELMLEAIGIDLSANRESYSGPPRCLQCKEEMAEPYPEGMTEQDVILCADCFELVKDAITAATATIH